MDKFFGCLQYSDELKKKIVKESGLSISYALASNKLVSKVATNECKPNGQLEIPFGNEKTFLSPLSIMKIPGIGQETGYKLLKMGVETVKMLSEIPVNLMYNLLGENGNELHRKANGIDELPVIPYRERKSIGSEETFNTDNIDLKFLHQELARMTEKIAFELRPQQRLTSCVAVKIRYGDFQTEQKQTTIDHTAFDDILIQKVKELFTSFYTKRQLVWLVDVRFTDLIAGRHQMDMFNDSSETTKLHQAMDSIKKQFGEQYLMRASGCTDNKNINHTQRPYRI